MTDTRKLTVLERALIRGIKHQIDESLDLDEPEDSASWEHGHGIILSRDEVTYLLSMITGADEVTL